MKLKIIKNKKAYFFSLDALIALIIIVGVVMFFKPHASQKAPEMHMQEDIITVLSSVKISEIDNAYAKQLISEGKIINLNQSVLEQIGEFYAQSSPEAELLADSVLEQMDIEGNVGIYFNNQPIAEKYSIQQADAKDIWTSRQIISGINQGDSAKGYSSRTFLSAIGKVKYFYFGGYAGDGNISARIDYEGTIKSAEMEIAINKDFSVYVNGEEVGDYTKSTDLLTPKKFAIPIGSFESDKPDGNIIELKGNNLYIAGGYIKINYESSEANGDKKYLPGIDGFINVYDSIYTPIINTMNIFLHYNSDYNIFLTIENKTLYRGNSSGIDTQVTLTDSQLRAILDYSKLIQKTIPLRIGLENASYLSNFSMDVDVFSITDISGSMADGCINYNWWCCFTHGWCTTQASCVGCSGTWQNKISMAKEANNIFIDSVLNSSQNRVGLVAYSTSALDSNYHPLSNNNVSLKAEVNSWTAEGTTCICCGINKGVQKLVSESNSNKFRSMVVMSDGEANVRCTQQGTASAKQDAIKSACDAYNNYGIKVYSVGFGTDADETTLQSIASCGHGSYYYGDVANIIEIYRQIAEEIKSASYYEQTVTGQNIHTRLYPDSYIEIDYTKTTPYGLIITAETPNFGNTISEGTFNIQNDTQTYEAKVISYSGSRWTNNVEVYNSNLSLWENVFNLSEYKIDYINLGDPYVINIPISKIKTGNNTIRVSTGLNPLNSTGGSPSDKIIYTVIKEISSYSPILSMASGCTWEIQFEDFTNATLKVPLNYTGEEKCYYNLEKISYNENDAINVAVYNLLAKLDLNKNRLIETKFSESDLQITASEVEGIPFTWETEVQSRVWR